MKTSSKTKLINATGYLIAAGTPVGITASQIPIWQQTSGEAQLSGGFLLACFLGAIPLIAMLWRKRKELKKYMSFTPVILCAVLWGLLTALEPVIQQLKFILMVSTAGEGAALLLFSTSKWLKTRADEKGKEVMQILAEKLGDNK